MDKAALLAEVINHVKELRKNAAEATKDMLVPSDIDEVRVEQETDGVGEASYTIRAFRFYGFLFFHTYIAKG